MAALPTIVVLTEAIGSESYLAHFAAALAEPLGARLVLFHAFQDVVMDPEFGYTPAPLAIDTQREIQDALAALAARLPVESEVRVVIEPLRDAVEDAIRLYQPMLLVLGGAGRTDDWFDRLFANTSLSILRSAHYPLLLVPEGGPQPARVPRHALVAVDGDPFHLEATGLAARDLFSALQLKCSVVQALTTAADHDQPVIAAARGLATVREGLHLDALPDSAFHPVRGHDPADVILQVASGLAADLLVLVARRRSFLGDLFHRSITAQVARRSSVPVLVLPERAA